MDIRYFCNGPRRELSELDFLAVLREFKGKFSDEDFSKLNGENYEVPLTVGPVTNGGRTLLFIRTDSAVAIRQYCGNDLAELIADLPKDGGVHFVECPACGTKPSVRTPGVPDMTETNRILGGTAA